MIVDRLKSVLAVPAAYRLLMFALGGTPARARFIERHVRAKEGHRILDIGCGPADIVAALPRVDYIGFDMNAEYIESAKRSYPERGAFYCQRVSQESLAKHSGFDIVLAIGILHHLDDTEAKHLFTLARSALAPGGRLVTLDACYTPEQSSIARFLISRDRGEYVRNERGYTNLAEQVFPHVESVIREDLLRVPYTHAILECSVDGSGVAPTKSS